MNVSEHYQLDIDICPANITGRATRISDTWIQNANNSENRFSDGREFIQLHVLGFGGSSEEGSLSECEGRKNIYPVRVLLDLEAGSWLVPTDTYGHYGLCSDEQQAEECILRLAEMIRKDTHRSPSIEAIRLDDPGQKLLRIYNFWFPSLNKEPLMESEAVAYEQ